MRFWDFFEEKKWTEINRICGEEGGVSHRSGVNPVVCGTCVGRICCVGRRWRG